jgi:uncharacterized protein YndB with AHSA1/START domain
MTEHGQRELRFTRVFEAPRELVFQCMIDADHLTHFWGPTGVSAPRERIHLDPRPGGIFETVMVNDADGSEYPTHAVYDEVQPPERLVWTEPGSGMRVFTDFLELADGRTEVHIRQINVPDAIDTAEAKAGFLTSLDRFAAYLGTLSKSDSRSTR